MYSRCDLKTVQVGVLNCYYVTLFFNFFIDINKILLPFCCRDFDPDTVTPIVELNKDLRQQNTIAFLHDRLLKRDLRVFQSILTFLDVHKVSQEPVAGGSTIMQAAASQGLHEFVNELLKGMQ